MKGKADTVEKYSILDIEPLIESIIRTRSDLAEEGKALTEEGICKYLKYNEGYISQLRSRENKEMKPQVSPRFYNQIKTLSLQNATSPSSAQAGQKGKPDIIIGTKEGQAVYVQAKDLTASYERIIEAKEETIAEKEARRQEAKEWAERAEAEKKDYLEIFKDYLKEILSNSNTTLDRLTQVETIIRADDTVIMNNQDLLNGNEVGKSAKEAGSRQLAADKMRKGKGNHAGAHKPHK